MGIIYLVGPMGSGKTTIGKQLAGMLAMRFLDSDHEIQKRTGASIPLIFDIEGEEGFRDRETAELKELSATNGAVIATGGGAILREENRKTLSDSGIVVYLLCRPEHQYERIRWDKNRPLIQTENPQQKLKDLFRIRDPLYRSVADYIVNTEGRPASQVANQIKKIYRTKY